MLNVSVGEGGVEQYVFFTRNGAMTAHVNNTSGIKELLARDEDIDPDSERGGYFEKPGEQYQHTVEIPRKSSGIATMIVLEARSHITDQLVDQALKKSINAAEAPHKANLAAANESANSGQAWLSKISQLPPRE